MKKWMRIESIRSAYDGGGLACGPVPGSMNAEAEVVTVDDEGNRDTTFVALTSFDNFFGLFETKESIFDKLLANDDDLESLLKTDVEGTSELKRKIAHSKFKRVYGLLYRLLDIPMTNVSDHDPDPIPDDDED